MGCCCEGRNLIIETSLRLLERYDGRETAEVALAQSETVNRVVSSLVVADRCEALGFRDRAQQSRERVAQESALLRVQCNRLRELIGERTARPDWATLVQRGDRLLSSPEGIATQTSYRGTRTLPRQPSAE
jgi:hypothetical protein